MASMPAAAAARATANASRFSSAAPVACARWRPSVADRVTAIGQATPSNGTGLFAAPQAASAAPSVADVGARVAMRFGQVAVAAQRRRRGEAQLARDRDRADRRGRAAARERARRADEDHARRARRRDGRGRAQGGVDRADADRRQREAFPIERARQTAQGRDLRFPRGQHQRRRHLRTATLAKRARRSNAKARAAGSDRRPGPSTVVFASPAVVRVSEPDHLGRADRAVQ